ncbi:MAG: hypothetical protein HYZ53_01330 [Planctomycetes bacterium]|nr:hypothetical protein [Planctomycetota bacterium]
MRRRRAYVLIIVLPLLALFAMLGSTFVVISLVELRVSKGFVTKARARMLAEAGLERTIAELRALNLAQGVDGPRDAWVFRNDTGTDVGHGTSLFARTPAPAVAAHPSFEVLPRPALANRPALPIVCSGVLGGTEVPNGDHYLLKVLDCASLLNLNSPDGTPPVSSGREDIALPNFSGMMQNLLNEIKATVPAANAGPAAFPALLTGANILSLRTQLGKFGSKRDLLLLNQPPFTPAGTFPAPFSEEAFRLFADFVTVAGWRDLDVAAPCPAANFPTGDGPSPFTTLRTERTNPSTQFGAPEGPNLTATPDVLPIGRYPINVNTAPRPVLVAVLQGLSGRILRPMQYGQVGMGGIPSAWVHDEAVPAIGLGLARALAQAIIARRENARFQTWTDFNSFLYDPLGAGLNPVFPSNGGDVRTALMVMAMANPNTRSCRFNPNQGAAARAFTVYDGGWNSLDFMFDKFGISTPTTEFCFSSMGYYEVESLGRVVAIDAAGAPLPIDECRMTLSVKLYDVLRHTTQRDFSASMVPPSPGNAAAYYTQLRNIGYFPENLFDRPTPVPLPPVAGAKPALDVGHDPYGSPFDGSLQLGTEWEAGVSGQFPGIAYEAPYRATLNFGQPPIPAMTNPASLRPSAGGPTKMNANGGAPTVGEDWNPFIFAGEDLAPDGVLCRSRGPGQRIEAPGGLTQGAGTNLVYDRGIDLNAPAGAIEFWFKLATIQGANEVLFAAVSPTPGTPPDHAGGLEWRLEKHGGQLWSFRTYWSPSDDGEQRAFYPSPDPNTQGPMHQEESFDISGWHAGEWHKVLHSWSAPGVAAVTSIDGRPMSAAISMLRDILEPNPESVTRSAFLDPPNYSSATWTETSYHSRLIKLVWFQPQTAAYVGGHTWPGGATRLWPTSLNGCGTNRFANATIDEVRFFTVAAPATSLNRFPPFGASHSGRFEGANPVVARAIPAGALLGTIGFTVYYPPGWGAVQATDDGVSLDYQGGVGAPVSGTSTSVSEKLGVPRPVYPGGPAGFALGRIAGAPAGFTYTLNLKPKVGQPSSVLTPVVDDVTLTLLDRPQILELLQDPGD